MERHRINPKWSLIPGAILLLMWLPGMNPSSLGAYLHGGGSFLWGILASLAYICVFNRIETRRHQHIFLVLSFIALPFIGYGLFIGGLLGVIGIAINTAIPLFLLLVFGGGALYKKEGVGVRSVISLVLFLVVASLGVWALMNVYRKSMARVCDTMYLGVWNEGQCEISPEQEARNIVYFSDGAVTLEDGRIFFDFPEDDSEPPHGKRGDLLAQLSAGEEESVIRFKADFTLYREDTGIAFVPLLSEKSGHMHIVSLQAVEGGGIRVSRSRPISVVDLGAVEITGWGFEDPEERVLGIQVQDGDMILLDVSPDGMLTRQ